ncbi:MAG: ANK REP REGION protein [Gammaproteobacteria bacterium]|nr:ANK REP REGION protein [Gammaproteobacteria bacterium]
MRNDPAALNRLLAGKADVNIPQPDGATALHWAIYKDEPEIVKDLIAAGADVSAANRMGVTPLILAAENGNVVVIRLLIEAGANPNEHLRNGETVLMMAVRTGNTEVIEVLLEHGADVNATETLRGTTALMWAAAYSNPQALELLIRHGADVSKKTGTIKPGRRPYLAPTAKERIDEYRLGFGQGGISIPVDLNRAVPIVEKKLSDLPADVQRERGVTDIAADDPEQGSDRRGNDPWGGLTALVFAARENDKESVKILLASGADVNQVTEYGWSPLLTATQNRFYQLGKLLLENKADPDIANRGGWTPLYIATDNRNIEGGDYPTRQPDMDHLEYIQLLLKHGADPNLRMRSSTETRTIFTHQWLYEDGATPFLRAAQSSDLALMKLLLEHGADPSIATEQGVTPLMVAAGIGWVEGVTYEWSREANLAAVKLILELGTNVNARDNIDGRTALMGAAHKGRNEIVQLLVDHGADLSIHDIGSRDSLHKLAGVTWQAIDYADGLVRVGVQSAIAHPDIAKLIRKLMDDRGLPVPPEGRTIDTICVVDLCK